MNYYVNVTMSTSSDPFLSLRIYGWTTDLAKPEIVSLLFNRYAKLTQEERP